VSLVGAVVVLVVGFVSGVVVRWVAGLAAIVALILVVLGWAAPEIGIVEYVLQQYYQGNELLFLAGLLFGIDAERTKTVVVERRGSEE
jgi:cell division protein FtsW (lipid II flippase)